MFILRRIIILGFSILTDIDTVIQGKIKKYTGEHTYQEFLINF